jgi:hypothetical protein
MFTCASGPCCNAAAVSALVAGLAATAAAAAAVAAAVFLRVGGGAPQVTSGGLPPGRKLRVNTWPLPENGRKEEGAARRPGGPSSVQALAERVSAMFTTPACSHARQGML